MIEAPSGAEIRAIAATYIGLPRRLIAALTHRKPPLPLRSHQGRPFPIS